MKLSNIHCASIPYSFHNLCIPSVKRNILVYIQKPEHVLLKCVWLLKFIRALSVKNY